MEPQDVERRLTTILAADVVGYSRLMGEDEAGTLTALKSHRKELIEPKEAQYHGRTVKLNHRLPKGSMTQRYVGRHAMLTDRLREVQEAVSTALTEATGRAKKSPDD